MEGWQDELRQEFDRAEAARARGNEGQARVCARRAAGVAIREYLARRGQPVRGASAMDLLDQLKGEAGLPEAVQPAVEHLTLRVTEEFKLPVEADLVADARLLAATLLAWSAD